MLQIIFKAVARKFSFNTVAGAAHTIAVGTTALDHEAFNHAVKDQTVVKALVYQAEKIVDGVGATSG